MTSTEAFRAIFEEAHKAYDQFVRDNESLDKALRARKLSEWIRDHRIPLGEPGDVEAEPDSEVGGAQVR